MSVCNYKYSVYKLNQIVNLVLCLLLASSLALAESEKFSAKVATLGSVRSLSTTDNSNIPAIVVYPLELPGRSEVSLITDVELRDLVTPVAKALQLAQQRMLGLFKDIPAFKTNVRLMDEASFYRRTGAPAWTNAMYYHGEIIIPIAENYDIDNINRSLRHEFSHAVIHALSDGKCPGWLDEGFAQWAEGAENPGLKPALLNWLGNNNPVPISALQTGFTRLNPAMVPAAYAQSLFASNLITQTYGFTAFGQYLRNLGSGQDKNLAFKAAFGIEPEHFEEKLHMRLSDWHKSHQH